MTTANLERQASDEHNEKMEDAKPEKAANEEAFEDSIDPENEMKGMKLVLIHIANCLCTFLVGLDFNLIATAVPVITSQFDSIEHVGWYGAAFFITLCASQPLAGKTYTLFPKRTTYLLYLAVFEIGSLVCATAPSSRALIAGRAILGFGASGIFAGGLVLITTVIPLHKRPIWQGIWSSTFAVASIIGPLIGGALTEHVSWRWCFYINLPIGGATAVIVAFLFKIKSAPTEDAPMKEKLKGLDGVGFILFGGSIAMLLIALQWGGIDYAWNSSVIIGLFVGSGVVMGLFVPWQLYLGDAALIPPRLFANRNVWLILGSCFFANGPFQTIIYWLPIWFQAVLGVSPIGSGVRYLPTVISDVLGAIIGLGIVTKVGWWNPFLILGEALVCLGGGLLSRIYPGIADSHWIGYQILAGVGYSLVTNLAHIGMQASLPKDMVPIGATNVLMVISTSCAIFLAIGQTVFQERLVSNLSGKVSDDLVEKLISVGATNIRSVVDSVDLPLVLREYSDSVTQVFYLPAAAPVISFFLICACRWTSIKKKKVEVAETDGNVEAKQNV